MIQFESQSDRALRHAVISVLQRESILDEAAIGVSVDNGIVTLSGSVPCEEQRALAQDVAHRVANARDLVNEISVGTSCYGHTDAELAHLTRAVLERVSPTIAPQIQVTVTHRWILLEGTVESDEQRSLIATAVQEIAGVCGVENALSAPSNGRANERKGDSPSPALV